MTAIAIRHLTIHAPIPGFTPTATCCATVLGGDQCPWHADADHDRDDQGRPAVRAAAVAHAQGGHRVLFDDAVSTVEIRAVGT